MNINLSEVFSATLDAAIQATAPADFPAGDLLPVWEAGELHFLTARDDAGALMGVMAYRLENASAGLAIDIIGMNAKGAPLALRMMFQAIVASADARSASLQCMIEKPAMERIAERFGMRKRATFFTREAV